jgi:hypothetical protein
VGIPRDDTVWHPQSYLVFVELPLSAGRLLRYGGLGETILRNSVCHHRHRTLAAVRLVPRNWGRCKTDWESPPNARDMTIVQHGFCQQSFELAVLCLQCLEPLRFRHVRPPNLAFQL